MKTQNSKFKAAPNLNKRSITIKIKSKVENVLKQMEKLDRYYLII